MKVRKPIKRSWLQRKPKDKPTRVTKLGNLQLSREDYELARVRIYERDLGFCQLTEPKHWLPLEEATLDHIVPRSQGRNESDDNLQLACCLHNSMKGSRHGKNWQPIKLLS